MELEIPAKKDSFDPRLYRPFEVIVSVTLHEIQGHLVQCISEKQTYSPIIFVEKLCFELHKTYHETELQLLISPAVCQVQDGLQRKEPFDSTFKEGFVTLSSLQFRGHAMFSNLDRPIESETLEYAWLVEVEVGEIFGRLTLDHLRQIVIPLEAFFFQVSLLGCAVTLFIFFGRFFKPTLSCSHRFHSKNVSTTFFKTSAHNRTLASTNCVPTPKISNIV